MASTFFGLNVSLSGLYTYQAAINTTAHNASNAETSGYSRQELNISAGKPISLNTSYGMVGTGVTGVSITQVRDNYYDVKFRQNASTYGTYQKKSYYMEQIENHFNELNDDGFIKTLNNFSGSLQDLATDPSSTANRTAVIQFASSMTTYINGVAKNLQSVQEEANTELKTSVDQINALSQQITALTKQINTLEAGGAGVANDLRDARNNLLDELSCYANITVSESVVTNGTGMTTFLVKLDDKILINTNEYATLSCVPRAEKVNETDVDGLYDLYWSDGEEFNDASLSLKGSIAGLFAIRDGNNNTGPGEAVDYKGIPYFMSKLNEFVRTLAKEMNDIHKQGTNAAGENGLAFFSAKDPVTGQDIEFGDDYEKMNALNFSVSSKLEADPNAIATAYRATDGVEKTDLLKDMMNKLSDKGMFQQGSPQAFLEGLVADIGIYTKEADSATESQKNIIAAVESMRMSISGVDTDEEAMNLVRYQNAYNLSAKVLQIMDELYDKLINYTGV